MGGERERDAHIKKKKKRKEKEYHTTTNCCMYNMYLNQQSIITTVTFNFRADGWDVSELTQLKGSEGWGGSLYSY